jgi:hypothetical protein
MVLLPWTPWHRTRRHRGGERVVRAAQAIGADVERLLLVLFFVVFAFGTILGVAQIVRAGSLY